MTTRIKLRHDTAANWTSTNPVLALGEAGYDTTNNALRIGDGVTQWGNLVAIAGAAASTSGNILLSENEEYQLTLNNNGFLLGGSDGYADINIGQDDNNEAQRAHLYISQDNPYIRSEVLSTTDNNYENDMLWHNPWYSRYSKITADAYGVHIKNSQWSGPGNEYDNRWHFRKDGVLDMPGGAEIRVNPFPFTMPIPDESFLIGYQDLTLTANTVNISGGRLSVNGHNDNWIHMIGPITNNDSDVWYQAVTTDPGGNVYATGGSYINHTTFGNTPTFVVKLDPLGTVLWQKFISDSSSSRPYLGEPESISWNSNTYIDAYTLNKPGVTIATTTYGDNPDTVAYITLNAADGNIGASSSAMGYTLSSDTDIEVNDMDTRYMPSDTPVIVGRRGNGQDLFTPSSVGYFGTGNIYLSMSPTTFGTSGLVPANDYNWYMFGDGLTGNVALNTVNYIDQVTLSTVVGGTGNGNGNARFTVHYYDGTYHVLVTNGGTGYADSDEWKITGDKLGGTTPTNDLTFTINVDGGVIQSVKDIAGTPTSNFTIRLVGDPVDFSAIATPTIKAYTSTDGFLYYDSKMFFMGNTSWDVWNTVASDPTDNVNGNIFLGGRSHLTGSGTARQGLLTKWMCASDSPIWSRSFDDETGHNEILGVAVDSTGNIAVVGENDDGNQIVSKISKDGDLIWRRRIRNNMNADFVTWYQGDTYSVAVDADNNIYATGRVSAFQYNTNRDLLITKFSPAGDVVWQKTLGTRQDDYSHWDNGRRDIVISGNSYVITGYTYGAGMSLPTAVNSNGFVAKFPLDGSGVGRYDDWYYEDAPLEIDLLDGTAANVVVPNFVTSSTLTVTPIPSGYSGWSTWDDDTDVWLVKAGGPGEITGLNELVFTNGARISNVPEEGLFVWQPEPTPAQLTSDAHSAEYVGLAYGGSGTAYQANIFITAGSYNIGTDDGNLEVIYYPTTGNTTAQRQVNIDIKAEGGDADNISNWHFDENGNMYLPAQAGYLLNVSPTDFISGQANATSILTINLAAYPKVATLVQVGDFVVDLVNENHKGTVIATQANATPTLWDITVSQVFIDSLTVPGVGITNQQTNGVVFSDGSKQQTAGRKIIQGWPGQRNIARSFGTSYNLVETLIWTASSADVSAFRGTVRCQYNDSSTAMKIYDVVGASAKDGDLWNAGTWDMTATPLIEIQPGAPVDATTFRLDINQGDLIMRIYATAPANQTVYMTTDITEFKYTYD